MGGCAIVLWGKDFVKMNKAACLVLFAALLGELLAKLLRLITEKSGKICSSIF